MTETTSHKKNLALRPALMSGLAAGFLALAGPAAHAQIYNVSLDTTGLTQGAAYTLEYQIQQGGVTNPNSSVNVSNFVFGPGPAASGPGTMQPTVSQNAMGSLQSPPVSLSTVTGSPSTAVGSADFQQNFINGNSLSFQVNGTNLTSPAAGIPADTFIFDLFDSTGNQIQTNAPGGSHALFSLTQTPAGTFNPQGFSYTGQPGASAGTFTTQVTAAPELGTSISFGLMLGLFGAGLLRARLTKRSRQA